MEANEQPRISSATKLNNLGSVVQDCAFLLRTGLFSEEIQPGDEIHNELTEIETRALLAKG
jgi:hypothetical protein